MKTTAQHRPPDILSTRVRKALSVLDYKYTKRVPQPGEALPPAANLFQRTVWDGRVTDPRRVSL